MDALFYLLQSVAVITIVLAWYRITALRKRVRGGLVGSVCNVVAKFVGLFTIGFVAWLLFPVLPEVSKETLVSVVFMCAAVFTMTIVNFFSALAAESGF